MEHIRDLMAFCRAHQKEATEVANGGYYYANAHVEYKTSNRDLCRSLECNVAYGINPGKEYGEFVIIDDSFDFNQYYTSFSTTFQQFSFDEEGFGELKIRGQDSQNKGIGIYQLKVTEIRKV